MHQQVGRQWWSDEILLKGEMTTYTVTINDYGYEWYEPSEDGSSCSRVTSTKKDDNDAELFVEYTVVTTTSNYSAKSIEQRKGDEAGPQDAAGGGGGGQ